MKALILIVAMTIAGPHSIEQWFEYLGVGGTTLAWTTVSFSDTSAASVPDGTTATTANTGLEGLTNNAGTAVWATDSEGRRYITGSADNASITVKILPNATINASSECATEILLEYVGTPDDTTQVTFFEVNSGGERLLVYNRTNASWYQRIQLTVTDIGTLDDDPATYVNPLEGDQIEPGKRNWIGTYWKEDASDGMLGVTLNGYPVHHYGEFDTTVMTDISGLNTFTPMDGTNLNYRIYGYRYSTSGALSDLITPVYEDDTENAIRIGKQYIEYIGPYSTDAGPGTISYGTDSGGLVSQLWRGVTAGGSVTLGLREGHAPGQLRSVNGRACYGFQHLNLPTGGVADFRFTEDTTGDIGIVTFRGDLGSASARPIYLDGDDTGETYNEANTQLFFLIFDEQDNKSALVVMDQTDTGTTNQHVFPISWDRTGGIPEINDVTITLYNAGTHIGMPFDVPRLDLVGPSSWSSNNRASTGGATTVIPNHIASALDAFPNHGYFAHGLGSPVIFGRTGQRVAYVDDWFGGFTNADRLEGMRLVFVETCINDIGGGGMTSAQVIAIWQEIIDNCVANNIQLAVMSLILLPGTTWDDDDRTAISEINAGVKAAMIAANRPDLMYYAAVEESFEGDESAMEALIQVDDTHPTEAGRFELRDLFVSLIESVGVAVSSNRPRDRSRDR